MATVKVSIGGRNYELACHPGEEAHIEKLAGRIDAKVQQATQAMGGMNEVRQFLFAALMLADDVEQGAPPPAAPSEDPAEVAAVIDLLAGRVESLADRLEKAGAAS